MPHSTSQIGTDIQDPESELPRIPLPRTWVNKDEGKAEAAYTTQALSSRGEVAP